MRELYRSQLDNDEFHNKTKTGIQNEKGFVISQRNKIKFNVI